MSTPLRVGLYMHNSRATVIHLVRCLRDWQLPFATLGPDDLTDDRLAACDVLLLHGGWYGINRTPSQHQYEYQASPEQEARGEAVRRYVNGGGGIVGICCGAFNIVWMGLLEADISRSFTVGMQRLEVVAGDHPLGHELHVAVPEHKDRDWQPIDVVRVSGPVFFPKHPEQMIHSYDWEQRLGAVLAGDVGTGRAVAISPHPERPANNFGNDLPDAPLLPAANLLRNALYWAAGRELG